MVQLLSSLANVFMHLLYPHTCKGCGTDTLKKHQPLCVECLLQLPKTGFIEAANNPMEQMFWGRLNIEAAGAMYFYSKKSLMQYLIKQLKYRNQPEVGVFLGEQLGYALQTSNRFATVTALVPVPLNPKRQAWRGYNQAYEICKGIANVCNLPILSDEVFRNTNTQSQTTKNRIDRWINMNHVFEPTTLTQLQGHHCLLVDDVTTTGATLEACGKAILQIPNTQLSIATVAYAL